MWYLDSGCSRHMTGDKRKFSNFKRNEQVFITYGDNNKGKIIGTGDVGGQNTLEIKDVLFVEGLKHNLLHHRSIILQWNPWPLHNPYFLHNLLADSLLCF